MGEVGETPWTPKASTSRLCRSTWENGRQIAPMRIHHLPSLIHGVVPARAVLFRERLSDSRAPPVRKVPQPPTVRRGLRGPDRSVRYIAPPLFDIRVPQAMARFPPGTRSFLSRTPPPPDDQPSHLPTVPQIFRNKLTFKCTHIVCHCLAVGRVGPGTQSLKMAWIRSSTF